MNYQSDFTEWDKLRIFYYVVKFKTLNKTAKYLNTSQPGISKAIQLLEYKLKIKLFYREPKGMVLTQAGQTLFKTVEKFFTEIHTIKNILHENEKNLKGYLKVAATTGFVSLYLSPHLGGFLRKYPDLRVTIQGTDESPDLDLCEADMIIHPYIKNRPDLVQELLIKVQYKLYASPEYLQAYGTPQTPEDLDHHLLIGFGDHAHPLANINWHLNLGTPNGYPREPYVQINSAKARFDLAEQGLGIMTAPQDHTEAKGRNLLEVLPHISGPIIEMYCIYPKKLEDAKRVQVFGDYLKNALIQDSLFEGTPLSDKKI